MEHSLQKSKCSISQNDIYKGILKQHWKIQAKVKFSFENIVENGAFSPKEQMLHFP